MSSLNKLTKVELVALIKERDAQINSLRHRVSVLEGAAALAVREPNKVHVPTFTVIGGVQYQRVTTRHGQHTRTRLVPVGSGATN